MYKLKLAQLSDVPEVALNLREDDKREVIEGAGLNPVLSFAECIVSSYTIKFITADGRIAGLAGVNADGCIWMMCTKCNSEYPLTFVKTAHYWLSTLPHKLLYNVADIRNTSHLKLLKHLGFKFLRVIPTGPNNLYFVEFAKLKEV